MAGPFHRCAPELSGCQSSGAGDNSLQEYCTCIQARDDRPSIHRHACRGDQDDKYQGVDKLYYYDGDCE